MKHSLKTMLSFAIAIVVLISVALVSLLAITFIEEQFNSYIIRQQELKKDQLIASLSQQYSQNTWQKEFIHAIGMSALYDGFIIKVYDLQNKSVWDAQAHDMSLCAQIMEDISKRMAERYPAVHGNFTSSTYHLTRNNQTIGYVNISYFGPYFLNENDFKFLDALQTVFVVIGVFSLLLSVFIGMMMAKRLSQPILKTVDVTKEIADGSYDARIQEKTNTKELAMLIESINHLAGSLENQEILRKQLTEDVSHELRTPIAVLQSHMEAMIEGVWEPSLERLESCNDEIKRIGSLVSDLEKLQKIESEKLKLNKSEVSLAEVIHKAVKSFEVRIQEEKLEVSVSGSCSAIHADADRISQVVVNLLSNAIKYSNPGGTIHIRLFDKGLYSGFSITDTGIGIPENELPLIFERFYRADKSRDRKTGGSGLGLAIVKSIVEAHGGKITVESKPNQGSCFEVLLPK
jgi:signal transduction histidine kinase